jgi:hypothetical protein
MVFYYNVIFFIIIYLFIRFSACSITVSNTTRVAQKVMTHIFFLGNSLLRMYEIHAQYNWKFPLHVLFFHIISIWPCASVKQGHASLPCTSSFPVQVAMSSLHESHSRHLQTLSHAVYPSAAQKDENLTAPDQDYRGDGGAQSNQIWRLPLGFRDLCEDGHCRAESVAFPLMTESCTAICRLVMHRSA